MALIYIILIIILFLAIYPLIRDAWRKRYQPEMDFSLALELILSGKKEAALEKLKGIVKRNSDFLDAYLYLSQLYLEKGDFNTALAISERLALRRNLTREKEKKILKHLAHLYIKGKRYLKAISILEELVKIEPEPEALSFLFALYLKEENFSQATSLLEKIAKVSKEKLPLFYAALGKSLLKKDPKEGIAYLEKGKNSQNPLPSLFYLANYYAANNEAEKALSLYHEIIEKNPNEFKRIREKMEEIYYSLGRFGELEAVYERLTKSHPDVLEFFLALAEIYQKKEMPEEAIRVLMRYRGKGKIFLYHLLHNNLLAKRLEESKRIIEDLIQKEEENAKSRNCPTCQAKLSEETLFCLECLSWIE